MPYILPPTISVREFVDFRNRVLEVREKVESRGYGTQAKIAFECKLNASRVSNVLRAKNVDHEALERIEAWLRGVEADEGAAVVPNGITELAAV